jgi:hypothetical protein
MIFYKTTRVGIFLKGVLLFNRNETNRDASSKEIGRTFKNVSFSEKSLQLSELVLSARLFYLTLVPQLLRFGLYPKRQRSVSSAPVSNIATSVKGCCSELEVVFQSSKRI